MSNKKNANASDAEALWHLTELAQILLEQVQENEHTPEDGPPTLN